MSRLVLRLKLAVHAAIYWLAVAVQALWRIFPRTLRIGITGSAGKTTARALLGEILRPHGRIRSPDDNGFRLLSRRALTAGPWYRFWVQEVATDGPGTIPRALRIFRPDIAVVTTIGDDHYAAFRGREAIALEKGALVAALPPGGTAVLNADDPLVAGLPVPPGVRTFTYGRAAGADLRAVSADSTWGQGFSVEVVYREERAVLQTGLVGAHWETAVLAAAAGALAAGRTLAECRAGLAKVGPEDGRLSVHPSRDGVTFLRDDRKAPLWSLDLAFEVLKDSGAARRIAVIGTLSDYPGKASPKYRNAARQALEAADLVLFIGSLAESAKKAAPEDDRLQAFETVYDAHTYLAGELRPGDLVLLKGSLISDHLQRLLLAHAGEHACWRERCGKRLACSECSLRMDGGGSV